MSLLFTTSKKAVQDLGVKILIHSPAGNGKTVLTATLPRVCLIGCEEGHLSLQESNLIRLFGANRPDITYDIPMIKIQSFADLQDAYQFVATSADAKNFDSFALDSISEIAEVVLTNAKKQTKDGRAAYGDLNERMVQILRNFRDLPNKNVYFSAKQEREADTISGLLLFRPSMPGKTLTQGISYFFDEVFALRISPRQPDGSTFRFLHTRADVQYEAKDRSGALDEMEEPHLGKIISKIKNSHALT